MTIESAYLSTHPDVLAAWADTQNRYREFIAEANRYRASYPNHHLVRYDSGRSVDLAGFRGDTTPGDGWRHNKSRDLWVPDRRYKAGMEAHRQLKAIRFTGLGVFPGMPRDLACFDDTGRWVEHGVFSHDGTVYVSWPTTWDKVENPEYLFTGKDTVDSTMWERCPLSVYYAAVEAAAAAKVGV